MRPGAILLSLLVGCLLMSAQERGGRGRAGRVQQPQQAETGIRPDDYATVEGAVYDANTGAPLAKAQVSLSRSDSRGRSRLAAVTDANGRFFFARVEPGSYSLLAQRNRYATQSYSARTPGRSGARLTIAPGAHVKDITFKLLPAAVVTGRVVDEDGEPVAYARVLVMKYRYLQGRRQLTPAGPSATTNDLGEYRLFGIAPGSYYVAATYRERVGPGFLMRTSETGQEFTYPAVYYPGVLDVNQTAPIVLRAGEERSSVDFRLLRVPAVRIEGRVVDGSAGAPPAGTMVSLMPKGAAFLPGMLRSFRSIDRRTGGFEITAVQPGSYVLTAMTRRGRERLYARQDLEVGDTNVEGVVLALGPGVKLSGSVELEGDVPAGFRLDGMRVYLQPVDTMIGSRSGTVDASGGFEIDNLAPGDYSLRVMQLPENGYLKSARFGDLDVLDSRIQIRQGLAGAALRLLVSLKGGQVTGSVTAAGAPAAGATVVLVPEESRRGREELFKTATTDEYGRFQLNGIAPGNYKVFAFTGIESGAYRDPAFLARYEDDGEEIKIAEGAQQGVELDLIETAESGV